MVERLTGSTTKLDQHNPFLLKLASKKECIMKLNLPLLQTTHLGFDSLFNELDQFLQGESFVKGNNFPPYNIIKENDGYTIEVALAGFKKDDIDICHDKKNGKVVISGTKGGPKDPNKPETVFLVNRIANRSFSTTFKVADNIEIGSAKMEDGILTIKLVTIAREEDKPIHILIK